MCIHEFQIWIKCANNANTCQNRRTRTFYSMHTLQTSQFTYCRCCFCGARVSCGCTYLISHSSKRLAHNVNVFDFIVNNKQRCVSAHCSCKFYTLFSLTIFTFSRVNITLNQAKKPLRRVRENVINFHLFFFTFCATHQQRCRAYRSLANIDI